MVQLKSQVKTGNSQKGQSYGLLEALSKSGLNSEQLAYLKEMTNSADLPAIDALQQLDSGADLSSMSSEQMRQYSESVAQAADVVDKESNFDLVDLTSTVNKQKTKKEEQAALDKETEEKTQAELAQKEALIAQAEAANQVATGDSLGQQGVSL